MKKILYLNMFFCKPTTCFTLMFNYLLRTLKYGCKLWEQLKIYVSLLTLTHAVCVLLLKN